MNSITLLQQIFEVCIIPLLGVLTTVAVAYIKAKTDELSAAAGNATEQKYLKMISETITKCVIATNQTYVDSLKNKDAFSKVNYLEDFTPAKETIIMEKPDFILSWYSIFDDKRLGDIDYWNENGVNTYMSLNSGVVSERTIENEINE